MDACLAGYRNDTRKWVEVIDFPVVSLRPWQTIQLSVQAAGRERFSNEVNNQDFALFVLNGTM